MWDSKKDHNDLNLEDDDAFGKADVAVSRQIPIATDFVSKPHTIGMTDKKFTLFD